MNHKRTTLLAALALTACAEGEIPENITVSLDNNLLQQISDAVTITEPEPTDDPFIMGLYMRTEVWRTPIRLPTPYTVFNARFDVDKDFEYTVVVDGEDSSEPVIWDSPGRLEFAIFEPPSIQLCTEDACYDVDQWVEI